MATGDAAAAAGMDLVPGSTPADQIDTELNKTRDYIAQKMTPPPSGTTPVSGGGTGATSAGGARSNLAVPNDGVGALRFYHAGGGVLGYEAPGTLFPTNLARSSDIAGKRDTSDGNFGSTPIFTPHGRSNPVSTSYVAAYINSDGRIGATPSAAKYKHDIEDYEGSVLDLRAVTYVLNDDEKETVRLGIVADEANDVEPMLVVHEDEEIESFKYELLAVALLKEVQRLAARVDTLEGSA